MELWIRSQDKMVLRKVEAIGIYNHHDGNCSISLGFTDFGYYKKERALEILDEIQKLLKPIITTTEYECKCKEDLKNKMKFNLGIAPTTKTEIKELSCVVYEMPKE